MSRKVQDLTINGLAAGSRFLKVDGTKKVEVSAASTIDLASEVSGTLPVANGGTGATSLTDGGILLGSGTSAITATGQPTNGQLLIGSTGNDPVVALPTGGDGIEISTGAGSLTIAADVKANSGIVIDATELSLDLGASNITGTLAPVDGGLGVDASGASGAVSFSAGTATIGTLSVPNGGTGVTSIASNALVKGAGAAPVVTTGILVDGSDNVSGVNNMTINGNLVVGGTTTSIESTNVNIDDNHLFLNKNYTAVSAQTGGLVVNYLPTATSDTVAAGGFTSTTTVATTGAATFAVGNFVMICDANNETNNGLFQVDSHAANVLTITAVGEDFVQTTFVADATVAGTIININIGVSRISTTGDLEVGKGNTAPITFGTVTTSGGTPSFAGATWYDNTVTTADATITTILTIPTTADSTNYIEARVVGRNTTDNTSAGFRYDRTVENTGGVLTIIIGESNLDFNEDIGDMTLSITTSGTDILIRVTGAAAKTVNWKASVYHLSV